MAIKVTSRLDMGGQWYGRHDIKRGDVFEVPTKDEAERLRAQGLVDIGQVSADELGDAYREDTDALKRIARQEAARYRELMPHLAARPGSEPIHTPRQRVSNGGWSA
jgi:hypothetical protein